MVSVTIRKERDAQSPDAGNSHDPEEGEGAARIEDQIVDVARADHENKLKRLDQGDDGDNGWQKDVPFAHFLEKEG